MSEIGQKLNTMGAKDPETNVTDEIKSGVAIRDENQEQTEELYKNISERLKESLNGTYNDLKKRFNELSDSFMFNTYGGGNCISIEEQYFTEEMEESGLDMITITIENDGTMRIKKTYGNDFSYLELERSEETGDFSLYMRDKDDSNGTTIENPSDEQVKSFFEKFDERLKQAEEINSEYAIEKINKLGQNTSQEQTDNTKA